ncbi:alpha/beta fold hydrolase [Qipengyuania sp. DGS5-3]|uniref:alpha/beta fold hydrolase n=1 Tax=Qipengyuania sp. DGS5-3 TaxID=3349632 RepID=UPI0036D34CFE
MERPSGQTSERADAMGDPIDRRVIPAHARETFWSTPDGSQIRRIDWPGAAASDPGSARGSILFFPGRGDNYEKYLETLEELHRAGWRVTASDWRGQAGSGRLGNDPVTGHIEDFSVWLDDLAHFWTSWKASTPGPHILVGHSMGGHLLTRAVVERRVDPDGLVLSAPMLRMAGPPLPMAVQHVAARLMCRIGNPMRPAWKWSEKPGEVPASRQALLTHDDERYADELWWRDERPELVMGPGSWRWVERAYASTRSLETPGGMERAGTPVLILSTRDDRLVSHQAAVRAAKRFPKAELVEFGEDAHHEILRETDAVRDRAMDAIFAFLGRISSAG